MSPWPVGWRGRNSPGSSNLVTARAGLLGSSLPVLGPANRGANLIGGGEPCQWFCRRGSPGNKSSPILVSTSSRANLIRGRQRAPLLVLARVGWRKNRPILGLASTSSSLVGCRDRRIGERRGTQKYAESNRCCCCDNAFHIDSPCTCSTGRRYGATHLGNHAVFTLRYVDPGGRLHRG